MVFDLQGGGLESVVRAMATQFAGTRIRLSVITLSGRKGRVGEDLAPLVDQFLTVRPVRGLSMIVPLGLTRAIRHTGADVVHLHSGAWLKGAIAARLAGVRRIVYTEHGRIHDDPLLARWLDRRAARLSDVVVAVSEELRGYLETRVGIPSAKLITISNGVDTQLFAPGERPVRLLQGLGIPGDAWILGSVGRLEWVKRYDRLVEILVRLRAGVSGRPVYLVLCGEGSESAPLRRLAKELGVEDRLRLPGWIERPVDYYRLFDVFALTSLSEGASISLLEAMACGAAPVVMDVGANAAILGAELSEQVVKAGDVTAFSDSVGTTLESAARVARVRLLARTRVVGEYNLARFAEKYASVYLNGLNQRQASA